jgi:hypothetical protein
MAFMYATAQLAPLAKFIEARSRGASRQELLALQMRAMPGAPADSAQMREKSPADERRAALVREWNQVD